ncbi:MAG: monovalent cation/H(+) antiporter subunit G [Burkholderiaceae bacterium]|nr:monovalent cation/H(+) antiporter subunit G [Burkholderiaceae bacterium]
MSAEASLALPLVPLWVDIVVSLLLLNGAAFCVVGASGLLRFPHFFLRAHPAALPYTMGTWSIAAASVLWFSATQGVLSIQPWTVVVLLPIGAPVAVVFLARAALFRLRRMGSVGAVAAGEDETLRGGAPRDAGQGSG